MAPMKSPVHKALDDATGESYSLTQLARRWHVPRRKVRRLLQNGDVPFVEVKGQIRVVQEVVEKLECVRLSHGKLKERG